MTEEMARIQKRQKQAKARKQVERAMDHSSPEPGGNDLERTVEHEKAELKRRDMAKNEFRHTRVRSLSSPGL